MAIFLGTITFFLLSFSSVNDPLERIVFSFRRFLSETPQEKVYLHTDRPYYAAGETVWFKAYLTAGPYQEASSLSSTIYAELIDEEGNILKQLKLFSSEGFSSGYLSLPDSLPSGNYLLRAYTNWMRNSGEDYFYHQPIKIWNTQIPPAEQVTQGDVDIQFFAEGGNLVNGILSKVAFKAIVSDGSGKVVKGKILEDEKVVASFESNRFGMGVFPLIPKKGKRYKALLDDTSLEVNLPISKESGIVMAVTNSPMASDLVVKIQASEHASIKTIHLLAQTRGVVCATSKADLSKKVIFVKFPKKEFPSGIAQIIALDENGNPLAERLVFIDHQDQLDIAISTDKPVYAPRDSIRIQIEAKTKDGLPAVANLSLSAFEGGLVSMDENKETIKTNLLISSELKGYIESPGYYFNPKNSDRQEALDFLLLTQGWIKYTVKDALIGKLPEARYRVEKGLTLRGHLTDKNNQPVAGGTAAYLSLYPFPQSETAISEDDGTFEIHDLIFFDSTKVSLQGKTKNGRSQVNVMPDTTPDFPQASYPFVFRMSEPTSAEANFVSGSFERKNIARANETSEIELDGIVVQGKRIEKEYTSAKIFGDGSAKIQVAGNVGLENQTHPLDLVRGRVAGVQVSGGGAEWRVMIQGVGSINSGIEPLIMVDNIPIDFKSLNTIPVHEIESYSVWKGPDTAIFGSRGANGVIGFYTKKTIGNSSLLSEETSSPRLHGYQIEKEFYSPKYPFHEPAQAKLDQRITLFWEPVIQTDSSGKASVLFYNHDIETVIQVEIEGISRHGFPGSSRLQYEISKGK